MLKKMAVKTIIYTVLSFLFFLILGCYIGCGGKLIKQPSDLPLTKTKLRTPYYFPSTEELGKLKDGTYFGEVSLPPYDYAKVKITVNDNAVKEFIILDMNVTW